MNAYQIIRNVQADLDKIADQPEEFGINEDFRGLMTILFNMQSHLLDAAISKIEAEEIDRVQDAQEAQEYEDMFHSEEDEEAGNVGPFADPTIEENFEYEAPLIG